MKEPRSFISRALVRKAASANRDMAPPTLMRLTPASDNCASVSVGSAKPITRLNGLLIDDTIRRLQAFEAAGADVLYSPGVHDLATIKTVVAALTKPFNLVMGFADPTLTVDQLSAAGVKRISVGGAMSRFALTAFMQSAREMKEKGSFTYVRGMMPMRELEDGFAAV